MSDLRGLTYINDLLRQFIQCTYHYCVVILCSTNASISLKRMSEPRQSQVLPSALFQPRTTVHRIWSQQTREHCAHHLEARHARAVICTQSIPLGELCSCAVEHASQLEHCPRDNIPLLRASEHDHALC